MAEKWASVKMGALVFFTLLVSLVFVSCEEGTFWQITDIHYDGNYSANGIIKEMCHKQAYNNSESPGKFGTYLCDSPYALMVSAITTMRNLKAKPDFVLWTGDTVPHVPDSTRTYNQAFENVNAASHLLLDAFPGIAIFPTIGNHDSWPANQVPPGPDPYFNLLLTNSSWSSMIPYYARDSFLQGGYYVSVIGRGLKHIGLNTILWYVNDNRTISEADPANHIAWLIEQLDEAEQKGEKVLISGHIPLGILAKAQFRPSFSKQLIRIFTRYHSTITAVICGHEHTDQFRILYTDGKHGVPSIPIYLSPSVTPFTSNLSWGANNPSIRLYTYDRDSKKILDYQQYYLDLPEANLKKIAIWKLEYTFTKEYGVVDASAISLHRVAHSFQADSSISFKKYIKNFDVSYTPTIRCDKQCKKSHICSITQIDYDKHSRCLNSVKTAKANLPPNYHHPLPPEVETRNEHKHHAHEVPRYMYIIIYSLVVFVLLAFAAISLYCCCKEPRKAPYVTQPRYVLIS